jgi:hypothetical protein
VPFSVLNAACRWRVRTLLHGVLLTLVLAAAVSGEADAAAGLVAAYSFDEGSGTTDQGHHVRVLRRRDGHLRDGVFVSASVALT